MSIVDISVRGTFNNAFKFFDSLLHRDYLNVLESGGEKGVQALAAATPVDSGKTADSWSYRVNRSIGKSTLEWHNDNVTSYGDPIAVMLQYGHGTGTGGYVQGRDYINPAISSVFDDVADLVWEAVEKL